VYKIAQAETVPTPRNRTATIADASPKLLGRISSRHCGRSGKLACSRGGAGGGPTIRHARFLIGAKPARQLREAQFVAIVTPSLKYITTELANSAAS
jgi:hypothetical protein